MLCSCVHVNRLTFIFSYCENVTFCLKQTLQNDLNIDYDDKSYKLRLCKYEYVCMVGVCYDLDVRNAIPSIRCHVNHKYIT